MPKKGYKQTKEHKDKGAASRRGKKRSAETKAKQSVSAKLYVKTPEHCRNIGLGQKGKKRGSPTEQARANMRTAQQRRTYWPPLSEEHKEKLRISMQCPEGCDCHLHSPDLREWSRKRLLDPDVRLTLNKNSARGASPWKNGTFTPNKLERRVEVYLNKHFPGEWRFNNGDFLVAGLIPDFVSADNRRLLEVFGDYWHRGQNPSQKKAIYHKSGFSCVVIWEHEFNQNPEYLGELIASL